MTEANKIKVTLYKHVFNELKKDYIAVPEVKIVGNIADMLVTNGDIHIYEIKSKTDTLKRLHNQIETFKKYANRVTVVADEKFIDKLLNDPKMKNIGIISVNDKYIFKTIREAEYSDVNPAHFLAYFNLNDLREILRGFKGWYKLNFIEAEKKLLEILSNDELRKLTLFTLKEKYKSEFINRQKLIKSKELYNALETRSTQNEGVTLTPLLDIPFKIFKDFE